MSRTNQKPITLDALLDKFRHDSYNTRNAEGNGRYDDKIVWIGKMIRAYASRMNMTPDEMATYMEAHRKHPWPVWYCKTRFPSFRDPYFVGWFETVKDFRDYCDRKYQGFRCPRCGTVSEHAQECAHRLKQDGVCGWCSYGMNKARHMVIIKECGLFSIPIFEPVPKGE